MTQACKTVVIFLLLNPALLAEACPRPGSGSAAAQPPEVTSSHGRLQISFSFRSDVDEDGLTRYCYIYGDGMQSPTLRVKPGDEVVLESQE